MKVFVTFLAALALMPAASYAQVRTATVSSLGASLYEEPSETAPAKLPVAYRASVTVLDQKNDWYVVRIQDRVGWMHSSTLGLKGATTATSSASANSANQAAALPLVSRSSAGSGRAYTRGPRGGCYYLSASGRKVYVDRSLCN